MRNIAGFTLLELMLAVAVVVLLTGAALPVYQSAQQNNTLALTQDAVVQLMRRAQIQSISGSGDGPWGVAFIANDAVLFKGATYATRDTGEDVTVSLPGITITGLSEVVFTHLRGVPTATGVITLTTPSGESRTITITNEGALLL